MKKGVLLLTSLFLLAGCALPLPLKVASWALDGISYLATNKSVAENGLSIIAQKDCSLMRPLKGGPVCIGNNYDIAQVLRNAVAPATVNDQGVQAQAQAQAEFETAAGPPPKRLSYDPSEFTDAWRFMRQRDAQAEQTKQAKQARLEHPAATRKVSPRARMKAVKAATIQPITADDGGAPGYDAGEDTEAWAFIQARNALPTPETAVATAKPVTVPMAKATETGPDTQPSAGLYYVIGSLTRLTDLDRLTKRRADLKSLVVVARVQDRPLYREVVGPFKRSEKQAIRRMIEKAGVAKAWLTFIDPRRWTLAGPAEISALTLEGAQTASLH